MSRTPWSAWRSYGSLYEIRGYDGLVLARDLSFQDAHEIVRLVNAHAQAQVEKK